LITPGGSTDDWDRQQKQQQSTQRFELLKGVPNVNQDELVSDVLESYDSRLVKKLLIPQQQKAASEAEDETQEITSMMVTHFPAPVAPNEDHLTRIKTLLQFLHAQGVKGRQVDPLARQRIQEHLKAHMDLLKKLQPQAYKALLMQIKQQEQQPMQPKPQPMGPRPQMQMPVRRQMQPGAMRMLS
jgi:hypothetical protein